MRPFAQAEVGVKSAQKRRYMHSTFTQKVIICAVLGFLAAALVEWGKVFVEGADDALNAGYRSRTTENGRAHP